MALEDLEQSVGYSSTLADQSYTPLHTRAKGFTEYPRSEGLLQVAVASDTPGQACDIVRTHAPLGQRVVHYYDECTGEWPPYPAPPPVGSNEVLMHWTPRFFFPHPTAGGNSDIRALEIVYVYAQRVPLAHTDGFPTGSMPFMVGSPADNVVPPGAAAVGIVG